MVLNSLSGQRSQIAKNINIILKRWGLDTWLCIDKMCKVQYKCTIYPSKPEDKFVVQWIKYFNNMIDGKSCMECFTKDNLINLMELISVNSFIMSVYCVFLLLIIQI